MEEIWKDIPNYEGYKASNFGKIFSVKSNKILKQHHNSKGYLSVNLFINKKTVVRRVNRLVAFAFLPNHNNYPEVNHKDGNKHNNCVDNLEWCTRLYNMQEAYRMGLIPRKANSGSFKPVKVEQYDLKNNLLNTYNSMAEASKKTNYKVQSISRYCKGTRKCKDYIFKYANK